ncbi:MAG: hypothetical protein K1X57_01360 [Gemmataceae bacterium]|nr:hypothetical protein [Gemmataceae bacterium]
MNILLIILSCVLVAIFGWAALNPSWIYRFTTMFAAAFAGFALPQLIGLSNETSVLATNVLPEGSLDIVILVSILCLFAVILGDIRGVNHPGNKPIVGYDQYDPIRLIRVAVGLTVSGFIIFQIGYSMLDREYLENLSTQTSGPITLLYFFQMMQRYGLALSVLCYFRYRSPVALMAVIAVVASQFVSFLFTARRGTTADLVFILILGTYFGRRLVLPAWLLGLVFVVGTITSNSIGSFRGKSDLSFLERFERAEILTQFGWTLENGGHELVNAAVISWCVEWEGDYDYGTYYWTQLVHAYFPGQIFGYDLKRMLMLPARDHALEVLGFRGPPGATCTGMCDAFRSFWYFGCIKFFVIAYVMGRWWYRANKGDLWSQLAYTSLMVSALHTVSHGTHWILNSYLHMFIFSYFPMYWCRVPKSAPVSSMGSTRFAPMA